MRVPASVVALVSLLVASPLLWLLREGSVDLEWAATRALVCLVASWTALQLVAACTRVGGPSPAVVPASPHSHPEPAAPPPD